MNEVFQNKLLCVGCHDSWKNKKLNFWISPATKSRNARVKAFSYFDGAIEVRVINFREPSKYGHKYPRYTEVNNTAAPKQRASSSSPEIFRSGRESLSPAVSPRLTMDDSAGASASPQFLQSNLGNIDNDVVEACQEENLQNRPRFSTLMAKHLNGISDLTREWERREQQTLALLIEKGDEIDVLREKAKRDAATISVLEGRVDEGTQEINLLRNYVEKMERESAESLQHIINEANKRMKKA